MLATAEWGDSVRFVVTPSGWSVQRAAYGLDLIKDNSDAGGGYGKCQRTELIAIMKFIQRRTGEGR